MLRFFLASLPILVSFSAQATINMDNENVLTVLLSKADQGAVISYTDLSKTTLKFASCSMSNGFYDECEPLSSNGVAFTKANLERLNFNLKQVMKGTSLLRKVALSPSVQRRNASWATILTSEPTILKNYFLHGQSKSVAVGGFVAENLTAQDFASVEAPSANQINLLMDVSPTSLDQPVQVTELQSQPGVDLETVKAAVTFTVENLN